MGCAMATARFYKKLRPENPVPLANGMRISFTTLDHLTGYFATDSEYVQSEFARHMNQKTSGITEIAWNEFESEYVEKKKRSPALKPLSREEAGAGAFRGGINPIEVLGSSAVRAAVAVKGDGVKPTALPVTMAEAPAETSRTGKLSAPTPAETFKPPMGKRFQKKQPPQQ